MDLKELYILPLNTNKNNCELKKVDSQIERLVNEWMLNQIVETKNLWVHDWYARGRKESCQNFRIAEDVIKILNNRAFNYQSKKNICSITPSVLKNIINQLDNGNRLKFYLLYNGGYRASPLNSNKPLCFEPDQTELMLLYQIGLLNKMISEIYSPGIDFEIVINNGVSYWVNDVELGLTIDYAEQFRNLIKQVGAEDKISLLVQSEISGFSKIFKGESNSLITNISDKSHGIVERFLGRTCSKEEAIYRLKLYDQAESAWAKELSEIVHENNGVMFRQVAHPEMFSFRPFPGGAIRVQNGTVGFRLKDEKLSPKLITSETVSSFEVNVAENMFLRILDEIQKTDLYAR